jgi:hypothetical protein
MKALKVEIGVGESRRFPAQHRNVGKRAGHPRENAIRIERMRKSGTLRRFSCNYEPFRTEFKVAFS